MKRPPGLWILLSAGVLWLSLQDVYGIRATSLIFGRSTTTTTTEGALSESSPDETATEASTETSNVTKPTLTGNPQLDYIWDPNLPKELNGYNLSEYPFYERVPDEEIEFKCDGLHDGFYASVPHKCQVYHHCLFGTRFDFLCANYTAFDQKTFICHFVSEVDCVNSKKYWHRNDALYEAASTTTVKPVVVYTPPPAPPPAAGAPGAPNSPRRPNGGRRRPLRRRRPQFDYYDYDDDYADYYEDRPSRTESRRRKRPRPRPRPVYEEDYEEYEDERYERRGSGKRDEERTRKPYDRRAPDDRRTDRRRNNKDRRKFEDDDKLEDEDTSIEDERKVDNKRPSERRYHKRRPAGDSEEEEDRRRPRPKGPPRRPIEDEYEEDELPKSDKSAPPAEDTPIIKPSSGSSIYDRPRTAPKIKPPVPKSEASKYAYKPMVTNAPSADDEYYDDYEEEVTPKNHRKTEASDSRRHTTRHEEERDTRKQTSRLRASQSSREDSYDEEVSRKPKPKYGSHHRERPRTGAKNKAPPPVDDDYDDYADEVSKEQSRPELKSEKYKERTTTTSTTTTTTTTTTTPAPTTTTAKTTTTTTTPKPTTTTPKDNSRPDTIVRIVKRPFLPSRGGNPFSPRGLQPVGAKAVDKKPDTNEDLESDTETMEIKPIFKPSPVIIKMPHRQKYVASQTDSQEEFKPISNRPQIPARPNYKPTKDFAGPRTTQKPKLPEPEDPLDIVDDEYDVTLNDALNPTLPNLPVRGFPAGFSSSNDYNYNTFQRPRYVLEGASSDYYQTKPARQRYEPVSYSNPQDHFVNTNADYKGQYSTVNRENYRPRVTQAYYSSY